MTVLIPDVSEWQKTAGGADSVDLAGIKKANGGAIILRVSYGDAHPDRFAASRLANARKLGFSFIGLYQYLVAGQSVTAQASSFCKALGKLEPGEVPMPDLEEGAGDQSSRLQTWNDYVEHALGVRPWPYSGAFFAVDHGLAPVFNGSKYHTWVAAYGSVEPALGHTLWQSTNGAVGSHITNWPGCGKVDTSIYHGTLPQLHALTLTGSASPPVVNPPGPHKVVTHVSSGKLTLAELCAKHGMAPSTCLRLTAELSLHNMYPGPVADWLNAMFTGKALATDVLPRGLELKVYAL